MVSRRNTPEIWLRANPYTIAGTQFRIREWGTPIFTESTVLSTAKHLVKEAHEVLASAYLYSSALNVREPRAELAEELADVMHLVFHCANAAGIEMSAAFERKFEKNQRRTWQSPDADGIVFHDKEG
jgi:NTP pyrophosphatase (non-canonical NTP hydrolase)